jgi:hypothetical protein
MNPDSLMLTLHDEIARHEVDEAESRLFSSAFVENEVHDEHIPNIFPK